MMILQRSRQSATGEDAGSHEDRGRSLQREHCQRDTKGSDRFAHFHQLHSVTVRHELHEKARDDILR